MSGFAVVGRRWGRALLDLATEQSIADKLGKELDEVVAMMEASAPLRDVFGSPQVAPEQQKAIIETIAQRAMLSPTTKSALKLLADKNRLRALPEIAAAYHQLAEERGGAVRAEVITAKPLSDAYYAEIEKALAAATGRTVRLEKRTDPTLIAGVVTRIGDQVFDGSLKNRLQQLASELDEV